MSRHGLPARARPASQGRFGVLLAGLCGLIVLAGGNARAAEKKQGPTGKTLSERGSILARSEPDKPWRFLDRGASLTPGDLLLGLPGSALESINGAVRLAMLSDLDELSPFPVKETAVVLHANPEFDLDFTLDRGRVDVTNKKQKGQARVRVRFRDRYWDLALATPGTRVALEIYGRWPPGSRFDPKAEKPESPVISFVLLVLAGQVERSCPVCRIAMSGPPGPALFQWDSVHGQDGGAHKLDRLPAWAKAPDLDSPVAKKKKEKLIKFSKTADADSLDAAVKQFLNSEDAYERQLGMYAAGALDKLPFVGEALLHSKRPDDWHNAVVTLRHWLGRGPGQDRLLYTRLTRGRDFTPAEAKTTIQLLHGFTAQQIARPELYEVLIDMLQHERLAIRGLAHWHLRRLAPTVKVEFNPSDEKKEWARAYKKWQEAIPTGQLPPAVSVEREN